MFRLPESAGEADIMNEVRAVKKLCIDGGHKHIIAVFDHGWLKAARYYYFDMELCDFTLEHYIAGRDIEPASELLRQLGPQAYTPYNIPEVYKIMQQITSAISYIHSKIEVHRDLKPRNGNCRSAF